MAAQSTFTAAIGGASLTGCMSALALAQSKNETVAQLALAWLSEHQFVPENRVSLQQQHQLARKPIAHRPT